jgi:HK97 family phage portal protein
MNLLQALHRIAKSLRPASARPAEPRMASLFAPPYASTAGWWRHDSVEQLRNYQSWVYAAVNAIAQEVARQRPLITRSTGQADHEQYPLPQAHPLCRLLERPNPWLTPWELWYLTTVSLELTGNAFWIIAPVAGSDVPAEIWVVPTPWVTVRPDPARFILGYEVTAPGGRAELFAPGDVVHIKYPNPLDPHYGLSPLQANALTIDANTELLKARHQTFATGARPGLVIATDQVLNDTTITRMEEKLATKFGGRDNWQRPLILEQGLRATPWTLSPAEMDFLNSSKLTRDEIFALFRVPPPVVGLVENTGLGSEIWIGARSLFCEGTVQPKLDLIGQSLTRDLGRRYGLDVQITFADCSPRLEQSRRLADETDAKLGLRTINEIRQSRGLKPYADSRFDRAFSLPQGGEGSQPK